MLLTYHVVLVVMSEQYIVCKRVSDRLAELSTGLVQVDR